MSGGVYNEYLGGGGSWKVRAGRTYMSAVISHRILSTLRRAMLLGLCLAFIEAPLSGFAQTIQYKYDSLNRVVEVRYPDRIIYYTYDAAGNRTSTRVELVAVPTISGLSPSGGAAGGGAFTITVNGSNFVNGATVTFNANARATAFVSAAQLTAQIEAADIATAGTYPVTVVNPSGAASQPADFTVSAAPTLRIDAITPAAGRASGGQQVKLTGSFAGLSAVTVGGAPASWAYTNGSNEVTLTTPQHAVGAVAISLAPTSGGAYTRPNAFAFLPTAFTDDTLVPGVTTAKGQHVLELRQAVDALRAVAGLEPAPWADATLTPTSSTVRVVHITELRAFLDDAATRLGYATQPYTDPSLSTGFVIRRIHIEELRQRVRAIAG
jgi:YD repeat-containing protein